MSTDKDWEKWGKSDPYFGVLSNQKFEATKLKTNTVKEFYKTGDQEVTALIEHIKTLNNGKQPSFKLAIDFGCGVGRLTVPLSSYAQKVIGLDVSPSMLEKAKSNLPANKKRFVRYLVSDDSLSVLPKKYDLVYSYIVLQHIPKPRGEKIIDRLLNNLEVGGYAAIHVTYKYEAANINKFLVKLRNRFVPLHYLFNAIKGRPLTTPLMRMHVYDLNNIYEKFYQAGIQNTSGILTDHGGYLGVLILGKKGQ